MSFCRFRANVSDVYVFENCDGFLECCGCIIYGHLAAGTWHETALQMLNHLQEHQALGHLVPEHAISAIRELHELAILDPC